MLHLPQTQKNPIQHSAKPGCPRFSRIFSDCFPLFWVGPGARKLIVKSAQGED